LYFRYEAEKEPANDQTQMQGTLNAEERTIKLYMIGKIGELAIVKICSQSMRIACQRSRN
jgi:hypothetical protein